VATRVLRKDELWILYYNHHTNEVVELLADWAFRSHAGYRSQGSGLPGETRL